MKYVVIVEKSANGFGADVPDLPGCAVVAETREEALELMRDAIDFHIRAVVPDRKLREAVSAAATTDAHRREMLKDIHLIEVAIEQGCPVVSLDEEARSLFRTAAEQVRSLRPVIWVNPVEPEEQVLRWLEEGAQSDPSRTLGTQANM